MFLHHLNWALILSYRSHESNLHPYIKWLNIVIRQSVTIGRFIKHYLIKRCKGIEFILFAQPKLWILSMTNKKQKHTAHKSNMLFQCLTFL